MPGSPGAMDCVGVVLSTVRDPVAILCVHAPPGPGLEGDVWPTMLDQIRPYSAIFLCGDFNAQHGSWGYSRYSPRGAALFEAFLACNLVSVNDSRPTYVPDAGYRPSNIDLIFCPLSLFHLANAEVVADSFGSDHLPVVLELNSAISAVQGRPVVLTSGRFSGLDFMSVSRASCRGYLSLGTNWSSRTSRRWTSL